MKAKTRNEAIGRMVMKLARRFPGFPVALIFDGDSLELGVIGLELESDDYFLSPASVDAMAGLNVSESIGLPSGNENPLGKRVVESDPGRTRTSNQLIKRQLRSRRKDGDPGDAA